MVGSSKVSRVLGLNGLGISRWGCSDSAKKRYCSRQKAVMVNLRSLDAVYRQVLVPESGTTLSGPISVAGYLRVKR